MTIRLCFIQETGAARLFAHNQGGWPSLWIPRSVIKSSVKFPARPNDRYPEWEITIEDWWADKYEDRLRKPDRTLLTAKNAKNAKTS